MGTKKYKPTSPGKRQRQTNDYAELTHKKPEKSLVVKLKKHSGRNNQGKITLRSRGGGNKIFYRLVDFNRDKHDINCIIESIEYDPYRTAFISLVKYSDGEKRYILTPLNAKVGDTIVSGNKKSIKSGNSMKIVDIPVGTLIHNIELQVGKGAQLVRSAGVYATITGRQEKYVTVKLPSGEVRLINNNCKATVGQVINTDNRNVKKGKAGVTRWKGRRSKVRGAAMNAADHPHGGGEGKAPVGQASPRTKWGKPAMGYKTRNKKKDSKKYILNGRK